MRSRPGWITSRHRRSRSSKGTMCAACRRTGCLIPTMWRSGSPRLTTSRRKLATATFLPAALHRPLFLSGDAACAALAEVWASRRSGSVPRSMTSQGASRRWTSLSQRCLRQCAIRKSGAESSTSQTRYWESPKPSSTGPRRVAASRGGDAHSGSWRDTMTRRVRSASNSPASIERSTSMRWRRRVRSTIGSVRRSLVKRLLRADRRSGVGGLSTCVG